MTSANVPSAEAAVQVAADSLDRVRRVAFPQSALIPRSTRWVFPPHQPARKAGASVRCRRLVSLGTPLQRLGHPHARRAREKSTKCHPLAQAMSEPWPSLAAMENPPSKSTGREIAEKAAEGALNMVPVVGSALALAFTYAVGYQHNQRLQRWMEDVAAALDDIQGRPQTPNFDELAEDPVFLDAIVHATRAAQATHQEEKLAALKNGVLHSFGEDAPSVDEQRRFFRLVDQFSPAHLRLLGFMANPRAALQRAGIAPEEYMAAGRSTVLERLHEFAGRREWYDLLAKDLSDAGLAHANLHTTMRGQGVYEPGTTGLGSRFLAFIADSP